MRQRYDSRRGSSRQDSSFRLNWIYPIPDPIRSEEEWTKSENQDLDGLSEGQLRVELARVRHRLLLDNAPPHWLLNVRLPALERRVRDEA